MLVSTNATQTVVGDGVAGGGYQLSDAEYDRITGAGVISVGTDAALGANPQMIIGDLSVDATNGGNEFGTEYQFSTYDVDDESGGVGSIRVVGEMVFTNAENDDVFLTTGTFELDAETGLLSLTGSGTDPAGSLQIEASHIHVAEGSKSSTSWRRTRNMTAIRTTSTRRPAYSGPKG